MFGYQALAAAEAAKRQRLAILLEPGYGKTVITATALCDLGAWPALVVAPAAVVEAGVWERELAAWAHTRNVTVVPLVGPAPKRERQLGRDPPHIEVVSYENLLWLTDAVEIDARYRAIVFDELSKVKTPGTKRFRRMRGRAANIPVRYGLTGTPVGNHLLDLWGELFMVAGPDPLGPTFGAFKSKYFEPIDYFQRVWRLKCCAKCKTPDGCAVEYRGRCACHKAQLADIRARVKPYVYVLPPQPAVQIPPVRVNPVRVTMPAVAARVSAELLHQLWAELPNGAELEALSRSSVAGKLRQLAGGAVYLGSPGALGEEAVQEGPAKWEEVHTAKLDALDTLLDELQGQPALVFYQFRHEATRIKQRLSGRRWADLATAGSKAIEAWNAGQLEVLLLHPASAGFGLNLQAGGHHVIWFALPWSWELWKQGNGRVARPGQAASWVTAHQLLCGPADSMVELALQRKGRVERDLIGALL
jgi:SNF2 family DNA or RNA helicase